jgi:peptidoglycan/xylan/chitin deacetylase (PgdA/CDA1 family)
VVARMLALLVMIAALGSAWVTRGIEARPLGLPAPAQVLALDPYDATTAMLRWRREDGARYRLCVASVYASAEPLACFDAGADETWPVGVPEEDGGRYYLTLQACRDGECAEPVRAGAIGRRVQEGRDFYATGLGLPGDRARVAGVARAGPASIRYYRAASGTDGTFDSHCPVVPAGEGCGAAEFTSGGSLVGIAAAREGMGEAGITLQLRDTPSIYFMFDDGTGIVSGGKYVVQSILDEYGVKGSFFIMGKAMQTYPTAVRALVAGGHRVGNHTWSHPFLTTMGDAVIGRELDQTEAQFRAIVPDGTLKPCFRAPNGDFNPRVLSVLNGRGYRQYTQTVSSMDYTGISAGKIIQNTLAGARDGAIVSFHTQEPQTAIALRTLVPLLLAQGYRFGLVC